MRNSISFFLDVTTSRSYPELTPFSPEGERKYLIEDERIQFLEFARLAENEQRTFCLMLYYTGARISEVLNMTYGNIDNIGKYVTIESLKKRRKGIFIKRRKNPNYK